ncbi:MULTISPECIES: copper resistance CopC family protein [unclassified Streptomyces]|uniref:copper resistance CopC family protein n=1 Tax=unclassified Streptomyces TaxID=2593676 RepID=UPI000DC79309|nr:MULTISPECIES: copper resistance CopC family protein [unclassified Streptomyces]AWZ05315.1 copper resistance protein CopC [Streptomyces sp. ICC4]AWZ11437.1 copper resistance protein CopC [Streptomyces sp. ICC1]
MYSFSRRAARAATRTLVVPLSGLLLWAGAPAASAHTDLTSSTPADGATLDALPPGIRLTFSDEMSQEYAKVALTAPDGSPAGTGDPLVDGKSASLVVKPGLPSGKYTVGYRVVSADGHPVSGSYSFTVQAVATATPDPAPSAPSAPPAASGDSMAASPSPTVSGTASSSAGGVSTTVIAGGLIVAGAGAGAAVFIVRRRAQRVG